MLLVFDGENEGVCVWEKKKKEREKREREEENRWMYGFEFSLVRMDGTRKCMA